MQVIRVGTRKHLRGLTVVRQMSMSEMDIIARNWRELIRPKGIMVDEASATLGASLQNRSSVVLVLRLGTRFDVSCFRLFRVLQ